MDLIKIDIMLYYFHFENTLFLESFIEYIIKSNKRSLNHSEIYVHSRAELL
jgi:hypothetical protein